MGERNYGNIVSETNPSAGDRFKFTGREFDTVSGLSYYRSRYYDPNTGRFISQDVLGFAGGDVNLYRHVKNDPLAHTDPSGELIGDAALQRNILIAGVVAAILLPGFYVLVIKRKGEVLVEAMSWASSEIARKAESTYLAIASYLSGVTTSTTTGIATYILAAR
jgi:RHS repeat-associated protein